MKMRLCSVAAAGAMMLSAVAQADVGVGVKGGSLGAGVELTAALSPSINARVGFNSYTFSTSGTESDIEYDADFKLQSTTAILDWHPFKGGFRLSAGYVFNNNSVDMTGKPTYASAYDVAGTTYSLDGLDGEVNFTNGAYLGMGWGNAGQGRGFGMSFEVGAVYQGSPDLTLTARGSDTVINNPTFQQNLAAEEADAQDEMADFKWYPAVALGLSYTF